MLIIQNKLSSKAKIKALRYRLLCYISQINLNAFSNQVNRNNTIQLQYANLFFDNTADILMNGEKIFFLEI